MSRNSHGGAGRGVMAAAFGVGLLFACYCPSKLMIAVLAIAVIMLGVSCTRC